MTSEEQLAALRAARAEVEKQHNLIKAEMKQKASEGRLWQNGQCAAWAAYEAACTKLDDLRQTAGT